MSIFSGWSPYPTPNLPASLVASDRGSELHLGDCLQQMRVAAGEASDEDTGGELLMLEGFLFEMAVRYMAGGLDYDTAMELAFKRYARSLDPQIDWQVALCREGVHMTPDGVNRTVGELVSVKHTRKSLKRARTKEDFESNFWLWQCQEKSYALELGVDTARWIVWWAGGDYGRGAGTPPCCLQATMQWSAEELVENWRKVMVYKPFAEQAVVATREVDSAVSKF